MARWELAIQVFPAFRRRMTKRWLQTVVERTLEAEVEEGSVALELVIADDATVRSLNHDYLGQDEVTDVLAFSFHPGVGDPSEGVFVVPAETAPSLGEVVVSYPQAARQARQQRHPVRREVALLVAHGVLHLLGYDHAEPDQEREMWARQDRVLSQVL